jgi:hypothetical protein
MAFARVLGSECGAEPWGKLKKQQRYLSGDTEGDFEVNNNKVFLKR